MDCSACISQLAFWLTPANRPSEVAETKARYPIGTFGIPQARLALMAAQSETPAETLATRMGMVLFVRRNWAFDTIG